MMNQNVSMNDNAMIDAYLSLSEGGDNAMIGMYFLSELLNKNSESNKNNK